jgi:hypothetical protein
MFISENAGASLAETTTTGMPRRTGSFTSRSKSLAHRAQASTYIEYDELAAIFFRRSRAFCPF